MGDRKSERVVNLNDNRVAGWSWFAAAPTIHWSPRTETGAQEIYALDREAR